MKNRLWINSLLVTGALILLASLTLAFSLGQAVRIRQPLKTLEHEVAGAIQGEIAARSLSVEIKEYADLLLGDEDVREEIAEGRLRVEQDLASWQAWAQVAPGAPANEAIQAVHEAHRQLTSRADRALASWDLGELEKAHTALLEEVLFHHGPRLLQLADNALHRQELVLHGAVERLRLISDLGLWAWLGAESVSEERQASFLRAIETLRFSRLLYGELLALSRWLSTGESAARQQLDPARWRVDRALEQWQTHLEDHGPDEPAMRRRFVALAGELARVRSAADQVLELAAAGEAEEAMEVLEDRVEGRTRDHLLPTVDALVFGEQKVITRELQALAQQTWTISAAAYGLSTLIVAVSLIALLSLRRAIFQPIGELRRAVERFRAGDREVRVAVRSEDEIGLLGTAFNDAVEALTSSSAALEARTREAEAARRQAEIASRTQGEFLLNISHEIRTPLNGLVGGAELLQGTELESQQRQYCEMIGESADSLLALIDDVLDASRLLTGELAIDSKPFVPRRLVSEVVERLRPQARQHRLALTLAFDPDLPERLTGDAKRIRQILLHLVSNALKFTRQGEVAIEVRCPSQDAEAAVLRIVVEDTGLGIPEDHLERIFEPFTQVDPSLTRQHGGAGLGLSISRQLAERMGGSLTVESQVGQGSRFSLRLELPIHAGKAATLSTSAAGA